MPTKSSTPPPGHQTSESTRPYDAEGLLTKEELRQRLNGPSTRIIDELIRKRKIPYIKLGHRTIRFDWAKVQAALEKLEIREIGRERK